MIVLIPSYEPDIRLVRLVESLRMVRGLRVLVVDDGSGPAYAALFAAVAALGATVLVHEVNRGKGAALKTGFSHALATWPGESLVCADSDGQHAPADILRVGGAIAEGPDVVLGVRRFTGRVPLRSRIGNDLTRRLFALATGVPIIDTQTGLRGYPSRVLPWLLDIPGDRFDYELRTLLAAARERRSTVQVEIETIYLDDNASSHFRPVRDSALIYRQLAAFAASSLLGFTVDVVVLALAIWLSGNLVASVVAARLVSASVNYTVNRRFVFAADGVASTRASLPRYAALAAVILGANVLLMQGLVAVTGSTVIAKVVTEVTLFVLSYGVQRTLVFAGGRRPGQCGCRLTRARSCSTAAAASSGPNTAEPATKTSAPASAHASMVAALTPPSTWIHT